MLSINDLSIGYGSRMLIEEQSASFAGGRLVALIGRNGAGKSTLLRVMAGLLKPLSGEVKVDDKPLVRYAPEERAKQISLVTTERVRIANMRCCDVVALGRAPYTNWIGRMRAEDEDMVAESLAKVGMQAYAKRAMDSMSDGECQKIMIARALAQSTPHILLDEPTSFLDMPNRYELCMLLSKLAHEEDKCIVFSTHELDIALSICDDIALIDSPRLYKTDVAAMIDSGHINRLFSNSRVSFDSATRQMRIG